MADKDVTKRLTDTSKYTGTHAERFNDDGTGKGKAGREELKNFTGSTQSASRSNEVLSSGVEKSSRPVVSEKTKSTEQGKNIYLYVFGNKSTPAVMVALRDDPSGTRVGLEVQKKALGMGNPKPKVILSKAGDVWKKVATTEDAKSMNISTFEANGKYLVVEKAGYSPKTPLDESKINPEFFK